MFQCKPAYFMMQMGWRSDHGKVGTCALDHLAMVGEALRCKASRRTVAGCGVWLGHADEAYRVIAKVAQDAQVIRAH
jgi:hypothetical protein